MRLARYGRGAVRAWRDMTDARGRQIRRAVRFGADETDWVEASAGGYVLATRLRHGRCA